MPRYVISSAFKTTTLSLTKLTLPNFIQAFAALAATRAAETTQLRAIHEAEMAQLSNTHEVYIAQLKADHAASILTSNAATEARWTNQIDARDTVIASLEAERRHSVSASIALHDALRAAQSSLSSAMACGGDSTKVGFFLGLLYFSPLVITLLPLFRPTPK
jgi:hypothetical protein